MACRGWQGRSFAEAAWARWLVRFALVWMLGLVDGFCCLGDMLSVDGDAGAAVEAGVGVGWSGFGWVVPLLAGGGVSLIVRDWVWCG